jgi:hypothetical protein
MPDTPAEVAFFLFYTGGAIGGWRFLSSAAVSLAIMQIP